MASRTASEIWSASLSGWPSVTDSEVNRLTMRGASRAMALPPELPHAGQVGPLGGVPAPRRQGASSRERLPAYTVEDGRDPAALARPAHGHPDRDARRALEAILADVRVGRAEVDVGRGHGPVGVVSGRGEAEDVHRVAGRDEADADLARLEDVVVLAPH